MEKRQPLQQMLLGKGFICLQNTETSIGKRGNTLEAIGIGKEFPNRAQMT
jgi:hypothetical protein